MFSKSPSLMLCSLSLLISYFNVMRLNLLLLLERYFPALLWYLDGSQRPYHYFIIIRKLFSFIVMISQRPYHCYYQNAIFPHCYYTYMFPSPPVSSCMLYIHLLLSLDVHLLIVLLLYSVRHSYFNIWMFGSPINAPITSCLAFHSRLCLTYDPSVFKYFFLLFWCSSHLVHQWRHYPVDNYIVYSFYFDITQFREIVSLPCLLNPCSHHCFDCIVPTHTLK